MNLSNLVKQVADVVAEVAEREVAKAEQRQDFLDALVQDLQNAAEVVDQINFTALEQLRKAAVQKSPLKDVKVDWSQFTDFVNKAEDDFGTVRKPVEPTADEMMDYLAKVATPSWNGETVRKYWSMPEHRERLKGMYDSWQDKEQLF